MSCLFSINKEKILDVLNKNGCVGCLFICSMLNQLLRKKLWHFVQFGSDTNVSVQTVIPTDANMNRIVDIQIDDNDINALL